MSAFHLIRNNTTNTINTTNSTNIEDVVKEYSHIIAFYVNVYHEEKVKMYKYNLSNQIIEQLLLAINITIDHERCEKQLPILNVDQLMDITFEFNKKLSDLNKLRLSYRNILLSYEKSMQESNQLPIQESTRESVQIQDLSDYELKDMDMSEYAISKFEIYANDSDDFTCYENIDDDELIL